MPPRLGTDTYFLQIATTVAQRSTCPRRQVGCVLVDSKNHIVATGYNGVPSGFIHCIDMFCEGALFARGEGLDVCEAIHAEVNAFLQLRSDDVLTAYMTVTPCFTCGKMFANSQVKRIVALEEYYHTQTRGILSKAGIEVEIYDSN
jgi:dCMP deaminase